MGAPHRLELNELMDEQWSIPPPDTLVGARNVDAFRACDLDVPKRTVLATSIQLHIGLVTTGRCLSILPDSLLHFSGKRFGIKALPIELAVSPRLIGIVTLRNRMINTAARMFIQTAREVTRPLSKASVSSNSRSS